jgi:putative sterol carrier protein
MEDYTALSRSEWLDLADHFYAKLRIELDTFTQSDWDRTSPYLGWRNHDLLAHMASAISVNFRQVLDRALTGNPSPPPEFNTFARNGREVARRRKTPARDVLHELWSDLDKIISIYRGISDKEWLAPAWFFVGPVNVRTLFLAQFGDNVFHARDMALVLGRWKGLDPLVTPPLIDWFIRELRPALFRPEKARDLSATGLYRLVGTVGGDWTMHIADGRCTVETGDHPRPDFTIRASAEDLVSAAQARAAPFVGSLARSIAWMAQPDRREDLVATITGYASAYPAILSRRIEVSGSRLLAKKVNGAFWHFWQRTKQTECNIAAGISAMGLSSAA